MPHSHRPSVGQVSGLDLQLLSLNGNQIGDAGVAALAEAIQPTTANSAGALASLEGLVMDNGPLGVDLR